MESIRYKELRAIGISLLFLLIGLLVILATKAMLITAGDTVFVSLLLIPLLTYVIVSGRVSEFKAPGGLEVKLATMSNAPVEDMSSKNMKMLGEEEITIVSEGGLHGLEALKPSDTSKAILLKIVMGRHYDHTTLREKVDHLLEYRTFKFAIFVNTGNRFIAYISSSVLHLILDSDDRAQKLLKIIATGNVSELWNFPGVVTQSISAQEKTMNALKAMMDNNLEAIPLLDENEEIKAFIERERILSEMLLAMAK
jgi:hypothetical protein